MHGLRQLLREREQLNKEEEEEEVSKAVRVGGIREAAGQDTEINVDQPKITTPNEHFNFVTRLSAFFSATSAV